MKTALIKTNLWDDDDFFELNIDTKIIYLLLLTSPERGVGRIYKVSDRILSARSGLSIDQINICKKQLSEKRLVNFFDSWVQLTKSSSFIQPVKGKLTAVSLERETSDIPDDVLESFLLTDEISPVKHTSPSSKSHVHDNDNVHVHVSDNVSVHDKDKVIVSTKTIDGMFVYWQTIVGYAITAKVKKNRECCSKLIKEYSKEDIAQGIKGAALASEANYAPRVSNFIDLYNKFDELKLWVKRETKGNNRKVTVI